MTLKEHTRMTEFKIDSVELDCENLIPLEHEIQRVQLSQDKKRIKIFYSMGDINKVLPELASIRGND